MKKRWLIIILSLITALCMAFSFAACGGKTADSGLGDVTQQGGDQGGNEQGNQQGGDQGGNEQGDELGHVHHLLKHEAQVPTCTGDGKIAYWECEECGDLFLDEAGNQPTDATSVIDRATGHQLREQWEQNETSHYHLCSVCNEKIPETEAPHGYGETWKSDDSFHWQECETCGKKKADSEIPHNYSETWQSDSNSHWWTCETCGAQGNSGNHSYAAGVWQSDGNSHWQTCETCGAQGNKTEHQFGEDKICDTCNYAKPSVGLDFTLNEDQKSYTVTRIGSCKDTDIVIPSSYEEFPVTSIGQGAFYGCYGLTSILIPDSVTSIGTEAFGGCRGLEKVHITDLAAWCKIAFKGDSSNPLYYAHHLYMVSEKITNLEIPKSVTSIRDYTFCGCSGLTEIKIPDGVTSIGNSAFSNCSGLTSITIPSSVTSIGMYAFENCSELTSIIIPASVTSIGEYAFANCSGLQSVLFEGDSKLTSIGWRAFGNCSSLASIDIPSGVTSIGIYAFENCNGLTSVTFSSSVTSIGNYAFDGCISLTTIHFEGTTTQWKDIQKGSNWRSTYIKEVICTNGTLTGDEIG